jgi:hypothetical protein
LIRTLAAMVRGIASEPSKKKYWKETEQFAERFLEMTLQVCFLKCSLLSGVVVPLSFEGMRCCELVRDGPLICL